MNLRNSSRLVISLKKERDIQQWVIIDYNLN